MESPVAGILTFESPAGELAPAASCRHFAQTPIGKSAALRLEGTRTHFHLEECVIAGETFNADIIFEAETLSVVELSLKMPGDEKGWEGWSEAGERARKERGEQWIARVLGTPPEVVPFELDGRKIVPFEKSWDLARAVELPGLKATSFIDAKAGFAGILIRYGNGQNR